MATFLHMELASTRRKDLLSRAIYRQPGLEQRGNFSLDTDRVERAPSTYSLPLGDGRWQLLGRVENLLDEDDAEAVLSFGEDGRLDGSRLRAVQLRASLSWRR